MNDIKKLRNGDIVKTLGFSDEYKGGEAEYIVVSPNDECDFLSENKEFGFKRTDDCKDEKCPHPKGLCKLTSTHEVTPNGFNIIQDKDNALVSHVLQFHDPMKEFKDIHRAICNPEGDHPDLKWLSLANIASALNNAICNFEKSHTEQNRPATIDFGELLPLECGFGDEK